MYLLRENSPRDYKFFRTQYALWKCTQIVAIVGLTVSFARSGYEKLNQFGAYTLGGKIISLLLHITGLPIGVIYYYRHYLLTGLEVFHLVMSLTLYLYGAHLSAGPQRLSPEEFRSLSMPRAFPPLLKKSYFETQNSWTFLDLLGLINGDLDINDTNRVIFEFDMILQVITTIASFCLCSRKPITFGSSYADIPDPLFGRQLRDAMQMMPLRRREPEEDDESRDTSPQPSPKPAQSSEQPPPPPPPPPSAEGVAIDMSPNEPSSPEQSPKPSTPRSPASSGSKPGPGMPRPLRPRPVRAPKSPSPVHSPTKKSPSPHGQKPTHSYSLRSTQRKEEIETMKDLLESHDRAEGNLLQRRHSFRLQGDRRSLTSEGDTASSSFISTSDESISGRKPKQVSENPLLAKILAMKKE